MRNTKITIGTRQVHINLRPAPYYSTPGQNVYLYGFPIYPDVSQLSKANITLRQNEIEGYYLFVGYDASELVVCNDISAGFRVYYYMDNECIYLCDDVQALLSMIKKEYTDLSFNENAYRYFEKHGYTPGGDTFFHEIKKLPPSSYLKITPGAVVLKPNFANVDHTPNAKKHVLKVNDSIRNTFSHLKGMEGKKILYFSGGKDSTLLALTLKDLAIPFTAVYMEAEPPYKENYKDKIRAEHVAKQIGMDYETQTIRTDAITEMLSEKIASSFPFDQHFYALHYLSVKQLKERYGSDLILINGQSSDTIFSYGSSQQSFGHYFACLTFMKELKMKVLLDAILQFKHGKNFSLPKNEIDFYCAFLDNFKNMAVLSNHESDDFKNYCHGIIQDLLGHGYSGHTLMMLLKIYTHLQGPDNQTVIKSALDQGITKIVLPYAYPGVIYNTIRYKSTFKELMTAKYPVNALIKEKITGRLYKTTRFEYPTGILNNLTTVPNNPKQRIKSNAENIRETGTIHRQKGILA